jgi:hypothetical protein
MKPPTSTAPSVSPKLASRATPLAAGRFAVAPEPHRGLCGTCPGRARLCSWEETMTLREQGGVHRA